MGGPHLDGRGGVVVAAVAANAAVVAAVVTLIVVCSLCSSLKAPRNKGKIGTFASCTNNMGFVADRQ